MYKRKKKRKEKHKKKKKKKIFAFAFFLKLLPSLAFGERFSEKTDLPHPLLHSLPQNSSLLNLFDRNRFVIVEGKDENDKTLISCKL